MKKFLSFCIALAVMASIVIAADEAAERFVTVKVPHGRAIFIQITEDEYTSIDFAKAFATDWPELAGAEVKVDWKRLYGVRPYIVTSADPADTGTSAGYLVPAEFLSAHPALAPSAWQALPENSPRSPWEQIRLTRSARAPAPVQEQQATTPAVATQAVQPKKPTPRFNQ